VGLIEELQGLSVKEAGERLREQLDAGLLLISDLVDVILQKSVDVSASDIHIEPLGVGLRVRYRVDGVFHDLGLLPDRIQEQLVARIKVLADLISHKKEVSQEGRIRFGQDEQQRDFRVSIVPTVSGEKVVLRMFDPARGLYRLDDLGYSPRLIKRTKRMLEEMGGMVVMTGPAGSGKTTTLYSCLRWIYDHKDQFASICTIEDPVEFNFGRFAQIQVNRSTGLDFAALLSAVLRQDPQVIMIGEIRDVETCEIALRAGLTGHMVLTTIHSGSACEVVTRILNMGIEPFVCASALTGVVAQRLVRRVCADCVHSYTPDRGQVDYVERVTQQGEVDFKRGRGCNRCGYTGFHGQVPIAESLVFDDQLRALVLEAPSTAILRKVAQGRGLTSLLEDGLDKVAQGVTTLDEVLRVVSVQEAGTR
jgi:type II secretory ATPase GspE/PulE/Tfp pilus assembly ATPase PilB-like protein